MTEEEYENAKWILNDEGEVEFATENSALEFHKMLAERNLENEYVVHRNPAAFGNFIVRKVETL